MLVLLSFALVLVATVLLVLGLLNDGGLTFIYISIACSAAAALVLVAAVRMAKPREEVPALAPEPLPEPDPTLVPAGVGATSQRVDPAEPAPAPGPVPASPPRVPQVSEWSAADQDEWSADDWDEAEELEFPIADYDDLASAQILPLLPQLYADEIEVVEERELATKARPEILDRLAELRGVGDPLADHVDGPPRPSATSADVPAGSPFERGHVFPIAGYDDLTVAEIRPLLTQLDDAELEAVRSRELAGPARATILDDIGRRLGIVPGPALRGAATRSAPRSSPAKRAGGRRAPAKKAPAGKKAAARRATVKKAAAKRATKKAAAKKASTKKAAAKRAAAKKAPARRSAAKRSAKKAAKKSAKRSAKRSARRTR